MFFIFQCRCMFYASQHVKTHEEEKQAAEGEYCCFEMHESEDMPEPEIDEYHQGKFDYAVPDSNQSTRMWGPCSCAYSHRGNRSRSHNAGEGDNDRLDEKK